MMYAPSAPASDARSEAAGDAGTSSRPSDNPDEAAPPALEGLAGRKVMLELSCDNRGNTPRLFSQEPESIRHCNYERQSTFQAIRMPSYFALRTKKNRILQDLSFSARPKPAI